MASKSFKALVPFSLPHLHFWQRQRLTGCPCLRTETKFGLKHLLTPRAVDRKFRLTTFWSSKRIIVQEQSSNAVRHLSGLRVRHWRRACTGRPGSACLAALFVLDRHRFGELQRLLVFTVQVTETVQRPCQIPLQRLLVFSMQATETV